MWAAPDDPEVAARMRTAHRRAGAALGVLPEPDAHEARGWRGRTLGQPVIAPDGPAWLRIACAPTGQVNPTFWDGSIEAEKTMPGSIPRPRLRDSHDWGDSASQYRSCTSLSPPAPPHHHRFAELVVITELLHATTRGDHLDLTEPLRNRAAHHLGRAVPEPAAG